MRRTSLGLATIALGALQACSDALPLERERLRSLELEGGTLVPAFAPDVTTYTADVGVLSHHARLRGSTATSGSFTQEAPLAMGENELEIAGGGERYRVRVTRHAEPWRRVEVLELDPPVENAYFGDYLRASERWLYVNASRRGRLYRREAAAWVFDRPSEELVPEPLEWMFEAALADDALAFVAQPLGGTETLYAFSIDAEGRFTLAGEHETNEQGTLRLAGDELAFVTAGRVDVLRRESGSFALAQTLVPPATGIGFALRPTYFDAPGVAFAGGVLAVGAPLASSPTSPAADPSALDCDDDAACAYESGAVLVYERDASGVYHGPSVLKPPSPVPGLQFGHATALSGDLLAVGAPRDGAVPNAEESGAVFLFRRDGAGWSPAGVLRPSVARAYDYFGDSLVLSGDVLLAGAPGQDGAFGATPDDAGALDSGGVFTFFHDGTAFREVGLHKLPPELAPPFPFPQALALAGTGLTTASNTAPASSGGAAVENAGRAHFLSW